MGTREKLFRRKLANQIEFLLNKSEKVFTSEKLDEDWLNSMLEETQGLTRALNIYQFLHDIPADSKLQLEFLELNELETQEPNEKEIPSYGDEILKEIDEFESQESVEVFEVEEPVEAPIKEEKEADVIAEPIPEPPQEKPEPVVTVVKESPVEKPAAVTKKKNKPQVPTKEINDSVPSAEPSLAEKLSGKSIKKLAESIALNERFLFSNELFNGNMEAFKRALTELDHIASKDDADRYINVQLQKENNWNMDSDTVQRFIQLVDRRFF